MKNKVIMMVFSIIAPCLEVGAMERVVDRPIREGSTILGRQTGHAVGRTHDSRRRFTSNISERPRDSRGRFVSTGGRYASLSQFASERPRDAKGRFISTKGLSTSRYARKGSLSTNVSQRRVLPAARTGAVVRHSRRLSTPARRGTLGYTLAARQRGAVSTGSSRAVGSASSRRRGSTVVKDRSFAGKGTAATGMRKKSTQRRGGARATGSRGTTRGRNVRAR